MSVLTDLQRHLQNVASVISKYSNNSKDFHNKFFPSGDSQRLSSPKENIKNDAIILKNLTFSLFDKKGKNIQGLIHPFGKDILDFLAIIDLDLKFTSNTKDQSSIEIITLIFNIHLKITGYNNQVEDFIQSAWHLDYHNPTPNKGDTLKPDKTAHPLYHLQFGGKKVDEGYKNRGLGNMLHLDSPRIATPPVDIVLGIDFLLSNFLHKDYYSKIKKEPLYTDAIKYSQNAFWKPYYQKIANFWTSSSDPDAIIKLIPQLIK
jgi:hypothetical protein